MAVLGTANLYGLVDAGRSNAVLRAALDAGIRRFDTAPSYGHGLGEAALGRFVAGRDDVEVTTKLGLEPMPRSAHPIRIAKAAARALPAATQHRLRASITEPVAPRFAVRTVRGSVERSLRRLGRVHRLLLHEVTPDDLTDELLTTLDVLRTAGDVGQVGVATSNELTTACVARAPGLLTTANVSVAPSAAPVAAPMAYGHGVFGIAGAELAGLRRRLRADASTAAKWQAAAAGTPWGGSSGLADVLLARAATGATPAGVLDGIIVATSRPDGVARLRAAIEDVAPPPEQLSAIVDGLVPAVTVVSENEHKVRAAT